MRKEAGKTKREEYLKYVSEKNRSQKQLEKKFFYHVSSRKVRDQVHAFDTFALKEMDNLFCVKAQYQSV